MTAMKGNDERDIDKPAAFNCQCLCSAGTDDVCHECQSPGLPVMGRVLVQKKLRSLKFLIAIVPMLTCLAALAFGLFALAMSHGSGPESYQVVLFVVGCLTPFVLLILWIIGFLAADILLVVTLTSVFIYLRYWAEDNYQWAQLWIAEYYEGGRGV